MLMQAIAPSDLQPQYAVNLSNVTAAYEQNVVFTGLSLEIAAGQFAGIVGPTACGKTTLLKTILGVHPVISGHVQLHQVYPGKTKPGSVGSRPLMNRMWYLQISHWKLPRDNLPAS